eukprot:s985_g19.t1
MTIVVTLCGNAPLRLRFDHRRGSDAMSSLAVDRSPTVAMHDISRATAISTGTVKGYDSTSGRYQVEVESLGGEIVPMSLREEYMQVLESQPVQAPAPTVPIQPPPPLPGGRARGNRLDIPKLQKV